MRQMEFEPTIPVLERAKTVHALDGAAIVIGVRVLRIIYLMPAFGLPRTERSFAEYSSVNQRRKLIPAKVM
jgi:hypothetical protein